MFGNNVLIWQETMRLSLYRQGKRLSKGTRVNSGYEMTKSLDPVNSTMISYLIQKV